MRALLRSNGTLEVTSGGGGAVVAYVTFGAHWAGWAYTQPSAGEPMPGQTQGYTCECPTNDGRTVTVATTVQQDGTGRVAVHIAANALSEPEPGTCCVCAHLFLSSVAFEDGVVSGIEGRFKRTPFQDDQYDALASANSNYAQLHKFTVISRDKLVALEVETDGAAVSFTDIRKWTPHFDVRIGQMAGDWRAGQWRVTLSALGGVPLSLADLRFPPLSAAEVAQFRADGALQLDDVLPPELVLEALREINTQLANGNVKHSSARVVERIFCETRIRSVVEQLLGAKHVPAWSGKGAQVALIYPSENKSGALVPLRQVGYHIDGIPTGDNGLEAGKLHPFTLLVGVYLNDLPSPYCGNLIVYPGSHELHAAAFRADSPEMLLRTKPFKMPVELGDSGRAICCRAGGIVVAHYLTAHGIAPNFSPHIRYALYYRITSTQLAARPLYSSMQQLWQDFAV